LSTAAIARRVYSLQTRKAVAHELILASGARTALPGPSLALASSGERIVVACADQGAAGGGSLRCYKYEGEGENLVEVWKAEGAPVTRILAVPGGRVALSDEADRVSLIDAATGALVWSRTLKAAIADLAYGPGLVLATEGFSLEAFDEATGASAWSAALTANARSISAGNGVALVLADSGSLSAFSLADGKGVGAAPGPFDPSLRPLAEGSRAIVALKGGGASEIDVKTGATMRGWPWSGRTSFIAADADRLFAGIDGLDGRGILIASRTGDGGKRVSPLGSAAFDSPQVVSGSRGGLLLLLMDGSLVLVGREGPVGPASSPIDAAIAPPPAVAADISSALGRFKGKDEADAREYLRFDIFVQGMPIDAETDFTAFRYQAASDAKRLFSAKPPSQGEVVAIYDDAGREIAASIDELGSISSASAFLEKGRTYWIVAGWTYQSPMGRFRIYLK
jgi:hypothetical protein